MRFAIFCQPITTIFEKADMTKETEKGTVSAISDEGLYGTACQVLERRNGWAHVLTHYGYEGYVRENNLAYRTEEEMRVREEQCLAVVNAGFADVLSLPKVQGVCLISLPGGSLVETLPEPGLETGWTKVRLLDGKEGYIPTWHLEKKRFCQEFLWKDAGAVLENLRTVSARSRTAAGGREDFSLQKLLDEEYGGSEDDFRSQLVEEAMKYMGVQYRWGGRSPKGIDCSGLVSMAYMRSGILIYRDASIADGYPIKRLPLEDVKENRLKKGDALYFPGHIAMYIGEGKFIHSTARSGSNGVVINSLRAEDPDFREDLLECLYAAGGVRI